MQITIYSDERGTPYLQESASKYFGLGFFFESTPEKKFNSDLFLKEFLEENNLDSLHATDDNYETRKKFYEKFGRLNFNDKIFFADYINKQKLLNFVESNDFVKHNFKLDSTRRQKKDLNYGVYQNAIMFIIETFSVTFYKLFEGEKRNLQLEFVFSLIDQNKAENQKNNIQNHINIFLEGNKDKIPNFNISIDFVDGRNTSGCQIADYLTWVTFGKLENRENAQEFYDLVKCQVTEPLDITEKYITHLKNLMKHKGKYKI